MDADTTRGCTPSNGDAVMGNSPPGSCNGSATASSMQASPLATSREADPTVKPVAGSGSQPAAPSGCNLEEAAIAIASGIRVGGDGAHRRMSSEDRLYSEGYAFEGAALVALVRAESSHHDHLDGVTAARTGTGTRSQHSDAGGSGGRGGHPDGGGEERGALRRGGSVAGTADGSSSTSSDGGGRRKAVAIEILLDDGVTMTVDLDSGEKRLAELGYKQDLRRALVRGMRGGGRGGEGWREGFPSAGVMSRTWMCKDSRIGVSGFS